MNLNWSYLDTWIVITGVLCALPCALLGNFLVLRRMSMMGDAISHAVLPGLAAAFMLTGSRASLPMFIGAAVVGVLTAVFTEWVRGLGKVDENASMGVVFTALFALGLVMIVSAANHVDLDPSCVLNGVLEYTPLDTWDVLGYAVPRTAVVLAMVLVVDAAVVMLLFKEFRISAFDPTLATTLGFNATLMHYLLMVLVAVTTVAAFESVGSILVVAMLIVPGAAARLLTDRLKPMVLLSLLIAAGSAAGGHVAAVVLPRLFPTSMNVTGVNTAGMMAVALGVFFLLAMLFAPRQGVLSQIIRRASLKVQIIREDVLGLMYRLDELTNGGVAGLGHTRDTVREALRLNRVTGWVAYWGLRRRGLIVAEGRGYRLTPLGRDAAREVVRSHRLWETYLSKYLNLPNDHLHGTAAKLEHIRDGQLRDRLSEATQDPHADPHGRPLPR